MITGWSTFDAGVRAHVKTLTGQEVEVGEQIRALATHEVTIRPVSGLTTRMRFVDLDDTTQVFNILAINRMDLRGTFQFSVLVKQEV